MTSNVSTQDEIGPVAGEGGEPVGVTGEMPGSNGGFSMAVFKSSDVPVGTPLYATPPADALRVAVEALEPFSAVLADIGSSEHDADSFRNPSRDYAKSQGISVGHIRRAAEALAALKAGGVK